MVFRALANLPAMMRQPEVDENLREVFRSQSMRNLLDVKSWGPKRGASAQQQEGKEGGGGGEKAAAPPAAGAAGAAGDVEAAPGAAGRASGGGLHHRTSGSHGGDFDTGSSLASSSVTGGALAMMAADPSSSPSPAAAPPPPPRGPVGRALARARKALGSPETRAEKAACGVFWSLFGAGVVVLFVWGFPTVVDKGIKPAITAVKKNLTPVQIAAVVFFGYIIVPCSFILGPNTFIWMAGLCFPLWQAVLLIEAASVFGVMLPFFLGKTILRRSAARLLARSKPMQVAVRAVDESGPWKVLAIIRLGPIPYAWCNYMCAIPHNVPWLPYLVVSWLCHAPINVMNVLFGQNLKGFADLLRGKVDDPIVLAYNVVGIVVIAVFCGLGAWGARRALRSLEAHQREQAALAKAGEAGAAALAEAARAKEAALAGGEGAAAGFGAGGIKSAAGGLGAGGGVPRVVASDEQQLVLPGAPALLPRRSFASDGGPPTSTVV